MPKTEDPPADTPFGRFARSAGEAVRHGYLFGFCQTDHTWSPSVNLYEAERGYRVCVDLAGVDKGAIDLTVHERRLVITGERKVPRSPTASSPASAGPRVRIHRMEIDHGRFLREVDLPDDVDAGAIAASHRNGLLWIELPKKSA